MGQFEQMRGLRSYMLALSLAPVLQEENLFEDIHGSLELAARALCREGMPRAGTSRTPNRLGVYSGPFKLTHYLATPWKLRLTWFGYCWSRPPCRPALVHDSGGDRRGSRLCGGAEHAAAAGPFDAHLLARPRSNTDPRFLIRNSRLLHHTQAH